MNMNPSNANNSAALLNYAGETINPEVAKLGVKAILEEHKLNWDITQKPVYSDYGPIENTIANYRSDNQEFLGLVSDRYQVLNNYEAFQFIDELDNFTFDRAGCSNNGKQVFIVGKTTETFELDENDTVEEYMTFIHGHDGCHAIKLIISPIRTFCTNQLNLLLARNKFSYSIKHIGDMEGKLQEARLAITKGAKYMNDLKETLNSLKDQKLENFDIMKFSKELVTSISGNIVTPRQEMKNAAAYTKIADIYNEKNDNQNYKGTKFGVLNAVSDYISHLAPQRTTGEGTYTNMFLNNIAGNKLLDNAYKMLLAA